MKFSSGLVRRTAVAVFLTHLACWLPATGALALQVGYYDMTLGSGNAAQIAPIVAAGHNEVQIFNLSAVELATVDILFVQNPSNGAYGTEYLGRLTEIENAVAAGLILIIHDHWADQAETILPGSAGFVVRRNTLNDTNNIDIRDATTRVTDGVGGMLTDASLDAGAFSSHGFAEAASLPVGAKLILSRTQGVSPNEDWIVTFSYTFGKGAVIYSTIPLVKFLESAANTEPTVSFRDIYAPNVIDYAALLALRIPDLTVTVDDGLAEAVPGEPITYEVVISNLGPGEAPGATVAVGFSSFLTAVAWTCTPSGTASCTAAGAGEVNDTVSLASGETLTYLATGTINPGATGMLTTTAMVTNPVGDDPAAADNSDADTDTLTPVADVSIAKAGPARADSGQPLIYTLTARNAGPSDASGVRVSDPTPSGLSLVSASAPCTAGFPCDLGTLPASTSVPITVTYAVPDHFGMEPIVNRASVAADPGDPVGENNAATSTTAVNQDASADLALSVIAPPSAAAGSTVTYRLRVENLGPHDAQSVMLAHTPPAWVTFLAATDPCDSSGLPCALGTINAGSTVTVEVTFGIPGIFAGSLLYSAIVSSVTADPEPANNDNSAGPALGADTVDLVLEKTGPTVAALGDDVTYTLTVTNRGPADATGVMLEDVDPEGLTFVAATAPCVGGLSVPPCDLGTLAAGERVVVTATWNIPGDYTGSNPVANTASVSAVETESFTDDDMATALTGIDQEVTDLQVAKNAPAETVAGGPLTYTLTVTNAGPGSARSVVLTDTPPAGLVPATATAPCDMSPFFPCDLGDLAPGETVVVGVTFAIATDHGFPNPLINTASVVSDNVDTDPANDSSEATTGVVGKADLRVTKTDGLLQTAQGLAVTYTIVVSNDGPSDVVGATVTDTFPAQLGSATWCRVPGAGTVCDPTTSGDIADSVDLTVGSSVTYAATAIVIAATGTISNTVTVAPPTGVDDPDTSNNLFTDNDTVIVPAADLVITKTGPAEAVPGTSLLYALQVTNDGLGVAEAVLLRDPTPDGLSLVSASAPCAGGFPCQLGDLAPAAVVQLTVTYDVPAGYAGPQPIVNIATVETISPDSEPSDNSASEETPVQRKADLDVTKVNGVESPDKLVPGEAVTYTIQIANLGPSDALGARVIDTLPSPPMAVLLSPTWTCVAASGALCGAATGSGAIDETVDLLAGGSLTYILEAIVEPAAVSDVENTVTVTPPATVIDLVSGNNIARDADGVQPVADLGIVKSNGRDNLVPGELVEYTIVVSNAGPSDALGVTVSDLPPPALTATEWMCTATVGALCGNPSGFGAIDEEVDLAVGSELTFVLTGTVDPAAIGTLDNTAEVAAPPIVLVDPVPENDSAADSDPLTRVADLRLTKTGPGIATRGMSLTFVLAVGNDGPSDATVVLTDPTPPGLGLPTVVETTDPAPALPRCGTGFPCLFDLAAAAEATFTVTYDVPADYAGPDPIVNRAALSGAGIAEESADDASDPDPSNNVAASAVPVERPAMADLGLTKVAPAVSAKGSTVTYRLEVTNHGPDDAPGVLLSESIPAGLDFDSASAPCETGFDCALGTLNAGASTTIEVTFAILAYDGPTLITNTASVSTTAVDLDPTNDSDDALTTLVADPFDLVLTKSGPLQADIDSDLTYTLAVTNRGPATATNTRLDDPTPTGLTFVTASAPCAAGFPCFLDTVPPQETVTIEVTFAVPAGYSEPDPIVNIASVVADPSDAFADNNTATSFTGISGQAADLEVVKTGPTTAAAGSTIAYALVVHNRGPGAATAVMLDDPAPAGTVFATASAPCDTGFPCALGDLPAGSAVVVQAAYAVTSSLASGTVLTNTATVAGSTPDPDANNDSATVTTTIFVQADLEMTKSNGLDAVVPGTSVTYTVAVNNLGPSDAPGVGVTDVFPSQLSGVVWTCVATDGSSCNAGAAGNGDIDRTVNIAAHGTVTYTATGILDSASVVPLVNTATATAPAGVPDPDPNNNADSDSDPVTPMADLAITKTDGRDTTVPGLPVTYTITAQNLGPSDAPGADVTDLFTAALTDVTWTCIASGGASCGAAGSLEILDTANLPAGGMVVYTASGTVVPSATGTLVNIARIAPSPENSPPVTDPNGANDNATDTDTLTPQADIAITKDDFTDTATPGGQTVYTIVVTNQGPSDAPSVQVGDTFQAPVTTASWTCSAENGGDCLAAAAGGTGDIDVVVNLPVGGNVTFMATADIDTAATGLLINSATTAVPPEVTDPVAENDTDTDTDTLSLEADLAVTMKNGVSSVVVGTEVTYAITVTNNGPSDITGATVTDVTPAALAGAVWTCTPGASATCTATGGGDITDVVNLPTGSLVTYTLTAIVGPDAGAILTNTATAQVPAGANDPDTQNNSTSDSDPVRREADLAVGLSARPDPQGAGGEITFAVTAENLGPSPATGSRVTLTLPPELPFVSSALCTHDNDLVTCVLGELDATATAAAEIIVTAETVGTWPVTAEVSSETTDLEPDNDIIVEETTVLPAETFIFADGFESGDFSAWSNSNPPMPTTETFIFADGFESVDFSAWSTHVQ